MVRSEEAMKTGVIEMNIQQRITAHITKTYGDAWGMFFSRTIREQLVRAALFSLWTSRDYSDSHRTAEQVREEFEQAEIALLAELT